MATGSLIRRIRSINKISNPMRRDIYQRITDQIIRNLEKAGSWQKLWQTPQPVSLNDHKYRGINHLLLSSDEFPSPVWGTFNQVRKNGGQVNKGEKSRLVVFWKKVVEEKPDPLTGEIEKETRCFLRDFVLLFSLRYANINSLGLAADLPHIEQDVNVSVQVVKIYFSG